MKRLITYLLFLFFFLSAKSQDVKIQVEYPSVVQIGQQFTITWTVNTGGGDFIAPSFEGFYKLMGPQTSYSSSTQIINGKMTHETSYSYVYYLQAVQEGKFVIAPASFIELRNKTFHSDSAYIEVIGSNAQQQNTQQGAANARDDNSNVETGGNDLFLDLSLSKREIYIGEPIVATVKIYTRVDLSGINEIKYPDFTNFLKADLETPPLTSLRQENVNGTIYGTGIIQQFLLYPQVTGEIKIDPVQITVLIQQKSGRSDPFFGDFFSNYNNVPKALISKTVSINVKPLPGNKPEDFSGIVGKLDLKAGINKDSVNVNDAVNFRITISGSGNLKIAAAPALKLSPDVEIYDPKITDNLKNSVNGTSGQKTFEYLMIPRHYGDFTVPPVNYSYFNTSTGKYEKLTTGEFHFHARKGTEQASDITVYGGISKEDVKYMGKDIRFIKINSGKLARSGSLIAARRSFYTGFGASLMLFLIVLFARREHVKRNSDISAVRNRKAGKIAGKRLREASQCIKRGEKDRFHEEILKALWGYLSDKLNIPVSDLTRNNAITSLQDKGIDQEMTSKLTDLLDVCESARYSPAAANKDISEIYDDASRFIRSIENLIG
jgi:hypothetical protein